MPFSTSVVTVAEAFRYAVFLAIYAVSHLAPSKPGLWVFGADGGNRFAENPKYLFLHVANEHGDAVRPVWLSDSPAVVDTLRARGYDAHRATGLRGMYLTLRAEYAFTSHGAADVAWWCTGGPTLVQLWHNVALKNIGLEVELDRSLPGRFLFTVLGSKWDYLTVTTARTVDRYAGAFNLDPSRILVTEFPRHDALFEEIADDDAGLDEGTCELLDSLADETLVAYMPTWRLGFGGQEHGRPLGESDLDFRRLDRFCADEDVHLLFKPHPHDEAVPDVDEFERVHRIPASFDAYTFLRRVDALITDYSSTFVDFLLVDRPILFYAYDLDAYRETPGFEYDYDSLAPGPVVETFDDLCEELRAALEGRDEFADQRVAVRDRFFDYADGNAAERVYRSLRTETERPPDR